MEKKIATVTSFTESQIIIKCPYCGQKHYHGLGGQTITDKNFGERVAHCSDKQKKKAGISLTEYLPDYEIKVVGELDE